MGKRIVSIAVAISVLFAAALGRVGFVALSGNYTVSSGYNSYTVTIASQKQTIYDRNMQKMNNNKDSLVAVIRPNENCLSELDLLFSQNEIEEIVEELSQGYPVVRPVEHYASCRYIKIFEVKSSDTSALLKYIQKQYGETAYEMNINFGIDYFGRILEGDEGEVYEEYNSEVVQGVVLTINREIQKAVEDAAKYMRKGAVVVMDAESAEILAMYSAPDDNMFRPVMPYTVGSVFKLVVTAAALENSVDLDFTCTGSVQVGDTEFSCQHEKAHGKRIYERRLPIPAIVFLYNLR